MKKNKYKFIIDGDPIAQARHRFHKFGVYDPSSKDKKSVRKQIQKYTPSKKLVGAIHLYIYFYCKRPKYHYGSGKNSEKIKDKYLNSYKITKPDLDNYIKFYMDCLDQFWEDDNQVVIINSSKYYANKKPRTEIMIFEI